MAAAPVDTMLRYLQTLAERRDTESSADGDLVRRFAARGEEAAFAALVRRHGPLVWQVCRRLLPDADAAEDVFQATFLVLARKAGSLRKPEAVGSFLYGVSYRLARRARSESARRRLHEGRSSVPSPADPLDEVNGRELLEVLEGELNALPARYRLPLVLCCLQGRTRDEAARQVGWSLRTLQRRLEQGRALLHSRLARRGLAFSGLLPGELLAAPPGGSLPAAVVAPTVRAALAFAARPAGAGLPSARAVALARGALRVMFLTRLKVAASLLLAPTLLTVGVCALSPSAAPPAPARAAAPPAPKHDPPPARPRLTAEQERVLRTEDAVAAGLQWIVRRQAADGRWSLDGTFKNDVAATAFALLPLLAAGHTHKIHDGLHPYARSVARGLRFFLDRQAKDGSFSGDMYANALATWAIAEAYGTTTDAALKAPTRRAVEFIVAAQHEAGGWRYAPKQPGDTSVTVYQILALASARRAGLAVPDATFARAGKFLDSVASADRSGYSYTPGTPVTATMSAAGHLCRMEMGEAKGAAGLTKWAVALGERPPPFVGGDLYLYHLATQALRRRGGDEWGAWEPKMRALLLDRQDAGGQQPGDKGSWPATELRLGPAVGRHMTTSLALLTLRACAGKDVLPAPPARDLTPDELGDLYGTLGDEDFVKARRALRALAASPRSSVPFLQKSLRPVAPTDPHRLARLIAELSADEFAVRERATAELEKIGEPAHAALRKALADKPSLEVRRRIELVLEATESETRTPELRRSIRAVEVLVVAGGSASRRVLESLAAGDPEAPLTRAAKSGIQRLDQRDKKP